MVTKNSDQQLSWHAKLLRALDNNSHGVKAGIALDSASQMMHMGVRASDGGGLQAWPQMCV